MNPPRFIAILGILSLLLGFSAIAQGQQTIGDVMSDRSIDWSKPVDRARAVQRMNQIDETHTISSFVTHYHVAMG